MGSKVTVSHFSYLLPDLAFPLSMQAIHYSFREDLKAHHIASRPITLLMLWMSIMAGHFLYHPCIYNVDVH